MDRIRPAAVAGSFYPSGRKALGKLVQTFLEPFNLDRSVDIPKAIIVPHAGYIYSGTVAAYAYSLVSGAKDKIRRVVMFGPSHRVWVRGLALPGVEGFATPLGVVPLVQNLDWMFSKFPQVVESQCAHAQEHSLEVQLPFLQSILGDWALVPFALGDVTPSEVAEIIECLWGGDETLIVVSSDLSHYLPYRQAQEIDQKTVDKILALEDQIKPHEACGCVPINGLAVAAKRRGLEPRLLHLCNSGDAAGERDRVVGYAAFAFYEKSYTH